MNNQDKILDKLAKLLAASKGAEAVGNIEESKAFAAKLYSLLMEYNLSLSEVELREQFGKIVERTTNWNDYEGMKNKRKFSAWECDVAHMVSSHFLCRSISIHSSNRFIFIGKEEDVALSEYLTAYLIRSIDRACTLQYALFYQKVKKIAEEEYDKTNYYYKYDIQHYVRGSVKGWRSSFRNAAIKEIRDRLNENFKRMDDDSEGRLGEIIHIRNGQLDLFIENMQGLGTVNYNKGDIGNIDGTIAGIEYGRNIPLNVPLKGESEKQLYLS